VSELLNTAAAQIVAVATALSALGWMTRRFWRFIRLSVHAFETIALELSPNGGGSTYDLVRKLKTQSDALERRLEGVTSDAQAAQVLADKAVRVAESSAVSMREALAAADVRCAIDGARTQGAVESLERRLVEVAALGRAPNTN
jgi:hypothetical protein